MKYYRNGQLHDGEPQAPTTNTQARAYGHDKQRREHRADLVQPWKDGQLNPEFEFLYPDESKLYKGDQS